MSICDILIYVQKVYLPSSFTKSNENYVIYGLPDFVTDYQICHLGNPSGLPEILPKIDPCAEKTSIQHHQTSTDMESTREEEKRTT